MPGIHVSRSDLLPDHGEFHRRLGRGAAEKRRLLEEYRPPLDFERWDGRCDLGDQRCARSTSNLEPPPAS
jgi:hypothetical protein